MEEWNELIHFTANDAWTLGVALRERLLKTSAAVAVNIAHANSNQILFHTVTREGTAPANDIWISRKRKAVLRWGMSTFALNVKMNGDEEAFKTRYQLGDSAGEYAIHGGGVPIRVRGVEGIIAVLVVSGLKQEEDHAVAVEALAELKRQQLEEQQSRQQRQQT